MIRIISKPALIVILGLAAVLTACYPPPAPLGPDAAAAVGTANALVARETSAANLATATAAHATQGAVWATEAAAAATRAAQEAAEATGTAQTLSMYQALEVEQTRGALSATALYSQAQATAAAGREEIAQEALRIQNQDYQEALRLQREKEAEAVARQRLINRAIPWLYGALFLLFLFILSAAGMVLYRRLNPKVITPYQPATADGYPRILTGPNNWPFVITDGLSGILQIPSSVRGTAEADPALALPSQAPYNLADHGSFDLGHYLIAGETRSGKGTLGRYILSNLSAAPYIVAIDPHYAAGNWGRVDKVIGAGRTFDEAAEFFSGYMIPELNQRAQELAQDNTAAWPPVLVIVDEAPAIKTALGAAAVSVWAQWLREGWKFNLYLMLITQSTRVETLGIKGEKDVLTNFAWRFALGDVAAEEFPGVVQGMERPAVIIGKRGEARPVIIPHIPTERDRAQAPPQSGLNTPIFTAPAPAGVNTSKGYVSQAEADRIMALYRGGASLRAIEREVYNTEKGQEGGANFYKIKDVIDQLGETAATAIDMQIGRFSR